MKFAATVAFLTAVVLTATGCSGISRELLVAQNNLIFDVNGTTRSAMVYLGTDSQTTAVPLLIFFHGHTGTASTSASQLQFHEKWPEATVAYAQGLADIPGSHGTDFGWQDRPGARGDRDLAYVDELITQIEAISQVDTTKIFAAGHSNGCMLTFVLLEKRNSVFAGYGPTSCYIKSTTLAASGVTGPVMYAFGTSDTVFDNDDLCPSGGAACAAESNTELQNLNGCSTPTSTWNSHSGYDQYTCSGDTYIYYNYNGDHSWPDDHVDRLVEFFKSL